MAKKPLLEGRKRSSELSSGHSVADKKAELLKLQSEELKKEKHEQQTLPLDTDDCKKTEVAVKSLEPALKPVLESPKLVSSPASAKPVVPKPAQPSSIDDANHAALMLQQLYFQMEQAGTATKYAYSMQVRHDAIVQEIKKLVQQKARAYQLQGLNEEKNLAACQDLVDQIRQVLAKNGIVINPLQLKNPKKR